MSWVIFNWDDSYSLLNLATASLIDGKALGRVMQYALLHSVRRLKTIICISSSYRPNIVSLPLIFCCQSLTSLKLSNGWWNPCVILLPKSLHLPSLKSLHLGRVTFTTSENDCRILFKLARVKYFGPCLLFLA